MRSLVPAFLVFVLAVPLAPARAETAENRAAIHQFFTELEALTNQLADQTDAFSHQARETIIAGGAVVAQNRNTISGGALGCAAGAAAAAGSAILLAPPTAGASAAAVPNVAVMGCALGALGGASLGWGLDHPKP